MRLTMQEILKHYVHQVKFLRYYVTICHQFPILSPNLTWLQCNVPKIWRLFHLEFPSRISKSWYYLFKKWLWFERNNQSKLYFSYPKNYYILFDNISTFGWVLSLNEAKLRIENTSGLLPVTKILKETR